MTVAPNAQKIIDKYIQNKSAYIKSSTAMLQQLKQTQGNPMAINAIGAQNLAMMFANIFSRFFANQPDNVKDDCRTIKANLLAKLAQLQDQLKENGAQNSASPNDADIVAEINRIIEQVNQLNCEIVDPHGRDETPIS